MYGRRCVTVSISQMNKLRPIDLHVKRAKAVPCRPGGSTNAFRVGISGINKHKLYRDPPSVQPCSGPPGHPGGALEGLASRESLQEKKPVGKPTSSGIT